MFLNTMQTHTVTHFIGSYSTILQLAIPSRSKQHTHTHTHTLLSTYTFLKLMKKRCNAWESSLPLLSSSPSQPTLITAALCSSLFSPSLHLCLSPLSYLLLSALFHPFLSFPSTIISCIFPFSSLPSSFLSLFTVVTGLNSLSSHLPLFIILLTFISSLPLRPVCYLNNEKCHKSNVITGVLKIMN